MSEDIPRTFIEDEDKAHAMARAENQHRTNAAYAKEAQGIIDEAESRGEYVNFIDRAVRGAERITGSQSDMSDWEREKQSIAAPKAMNAWENSLDTNASLFESKHINDFVVDSAARSLHSEVRLHERAANKAGKLAGKLYDKQQREKPSDIAA